MIQLKNPLVLMTKNLTMQKVIYFFRVCTIILLIISCKENSKPTNENKKNEQSTKSFVFLGDTIPKVIDLEVQDTVYRGVYAYGSLRYDMSVDTIDVSNIDERIIMLYISIEKNLKTFEDIINSKQNIFIDTIGDGIFNFKFIFPKAGKNKLIIGLEDYILLKEYPPGDSIQIPNSRLTFMYDYNLK